MALKTTLEDAKDRLDALLTYANGVTGESDTNIGDAIETLANGYGQGGGGVGTLIDTISVVNERTKSIDVDMTWFDTYDLILIVPDISISIDKDWIYLLLDTTAASGGRYSDELSKCDSSYSCMLKKDTETKFKGVWSVTGMKEKTNGYNFEASTNLLFYAYRQNDLMNGNFKVYGIKL